MAEIVSHSFKFDRIHRLSPKLSLTLNSTTALLRKSLNNQPIFFHRDLLSNHQEYGNNTSLAKMKASFSTSIQQKPQVVHIKMEVEKGLKDLNGVLEVFLRIGQVDMEKNKELVQTCSL
jgi:hypothetical protein